MKYGGLSLLGSYHAVNQDCYAVRQVTGGYVLAVSDGLGSHIHSQAGSATLCTAACELANSLECRLVSKELFLQKLHELWLDLLAKACLKVKDCRATALIGVVGEKDLWLFRLGDGFIGAVVDDVVCVMFDDKDEYCINETDCLGSTLELDLWEYHHFQAQSFRGIVAGTDGLMLPSAIPPLTDFTREFCMAYRDMELPAILKDIGDWLPKYKGIDDKTLAFIIDDRAKGDEDSGNN